MKKACVTLLAAVCLGLFGTSTAAQTPLTPALGIFPFELGFGMICQGQSRDRTIDLFNVAVDSTSILTITDLAVDSQFPFALVNPPMTPFDIPGDGTRVTLTVRFSPIEGGSQKGTLSISAQPPVEGPNPRLVPISGISDLPPVCNAGGPYSGQIGEAIQFDGTGSSDPDPGLLTYHWEFGDGSTATGPTPTHVYATSGVFTVTLGVRGDAGCSTVFCETTATINAPPFCDANGPYTGDIGTPIQFDGSGSSDSDGTIASYAWNFGDGSTGSGVNPTHTYNAAGSFLATLCVTDDDSATSCCEANVTVLPPTAVELSSFTASSGGGVVTLQWSTSFEQENSGFNVERADRGSDVYTKLGDVEAIDEDEGDTPGSYSYVDRSVEPGRAYQYRLQAVDRFGGTQYVGLPLEVAVSTLVPTRLVLSQNNPNPFNPSTSISFALPEGGKVALRIYDAQGHLVRTLVDRDLPAESHVVEWDGKDDAGLSVGSGVYLYRLETARAVLQNKMVLMK